MKNSKLIFWAVVDSLGIFAYVSLVSWVMFNAEYIFDNSKPDDFTAPLMILLLFVMSATITGSLFLGRPIYLYFDGMKKEGVKLFLYTLACLVLITLIIFAIKIR